MSGFSSAFAILQRVGRSLMLPIAVLPAAALLLRFGQPDMLGKDGLGSFWPWLLPVANVMAAAGGALLDNMPILFAIGVAIGFARKADGSTALAALVGYLVFDQVTKNIFFDSSVAAVKNAVTVQISTNGVVAPALNVGAKNPTGVLGGIAIGLTAALLFQRFYRIKLPTWLAFFGGRRFVPIVTSIAALLLGVIFGLLWPPIGQGLSNFGTWLAENSTVGSGIFGVANRFLIPIGLHYFINTIVWFTVPQCTVNGKVFDGDLNCYLAGQDGAGIFMTGFFPVMMFGLPAAALAIWRCARPENRATVGGIMISGALTSFVTGITEPIEFAFIYVAPLLLAVHAFLTGISLAITTELGARLGFGFSAGGIDMLLNAGKSNTHKLWLVILLGLIYFVVYYVIFSFLIKKLNIPTPGREPEDTAADSPEAERL